MKVVVVTRSGKSLGEYECSPDERVGEFKKRFFKDKRVDVNRQRFTVQNHIPGVTDNRDKKTDQVISVSLTNSDKTFADYGIPADIGTLKLEFKDLGPQISWQTVFFVEYFGPLIAHVLPYYFPQYFYGSGSTKFHKNLTQQVAFGLVVFHYLKREFETAFIHRFSNETMPLLNIFKNSSHYWALGGIFISYFLYHPKYTQPFNNPTVIYGLAGLMVLCELGNLHAHYTLRNLRPAGTKKRGIPEGQLFNLVSCANYTWEVSSWLTFSILTGCLTSWTFLLVSSVQMYFWAVKKHSNYKKEFPSYPRGRKSIIPFLL